MAMDHVKEYSVDWSDDGGISAESHKEYLDAFGEDFYNKVKRLIDSGAQGQDEEVKVRSLGQRWRYTVYLY